MSRYPGPRSILIMDNCAIHKSRMLAEAVTENGMYAFLSFGR